MILAGLKGQPSKAEDWGLQTGYMRLSYNWGILFGDSILVSIFGFPRTI